MPKRLGMTTYLDQAVTDWLETHHIRAKDVKYWSGTSSINDLTELTITFHVSGVDEIEPAPAPVETAFDPTLTFRSRGLTDEEKDELRIKFREAMKGPAVVLPPDTPGPVWPWTTEGAEPPDPGEEFKH
jgi:hypothetical protein